MYEESNNAEKLNEAKNGELEKFLDDSVSRNSTNFFGVGEYEAVES